MLSSLYVIISSFIAISDSGSTCCYGAQCPASTFYPVSDSLNGFTYTDGQEIASDSSLEGVLAISVSSCCPDGGSVWVHWDGDDSIENGCRCGDDTNWYTQSSCIDSSGYIGCAPTSSPTAEICPDTTPYEITGNTYSVNGVAYCSIGDDFNIPPTISAEQRCDIGTFVFLSFVSLA